jgi:polar amino acid transport system substrate-binding protein
VCTIGSTTSADELAGLEKSGGFRIVFAENWSDCLVLLQQGAVQAMSTDDTILQGLQAQDPNLKVVGAVPGDRVFSNEPHGLVFPKSDPASADNSQFVGFANGVIAYLESPASRTGYCPEPVTAGDASCWAAMYRTWLGTSVPTPPKPAYLP